MSEITNDNWTDLFRAARQGEPAICLHWRVFRKAGQPFLILPQKAKPAIAALSLYPAQTHPARIAKTLLRFAFKTGFTMLGQAADLTIPKDDDLLRHVAKLANTTVSSLCPPAILAGNPAAPGRRFILMVFGSDLSPSAIVKAGVSEPARKLVAREATFLAGLPRPLPAVPKVRAAFQSRRLELLAMDYFAGDPPRIHNPRLIGQLLGSWLARNESVALGGLPAWRRLEKACRNQPLFVHLERQLPGILICPTLYHGDFAPWNIKVSQPDGRWTVLDWERAELQGIPTWDWFHYVIHEALLARKLSMSELIEEIEALLACEPFRAYAHQAGVAGMEKELLLAYALYNLTVIRPTEGLALAQQILDALVARWGPK